MFPNTRTPTRACAALILLFAGAGMHASSGEESALSQQRTVALALAGDPYIQSSSLRERALRSEAVAALSLDSPRLRFGALNLPTDGFDFNQEPMTQLSIGVSQALPRGDSRELSAQQQRLLAQRQYWLRLERRAMVTQRVRELWLRIYRSERSIALIEGDRALFEKLVDVAELGYASALPGTGQQDVIQAQLELSALEDRLTDLRLHADGARQRLAEWVGPLALTGPMPEGLPAEVRGAADIGPSELSQMISDHPTVKVLQRQADAADSASALAREQSKPAWELSAQYGWRDDQPNGLSRADFLSLSASVDLPWFSRNRQDAKLAAALDRAAALRSDEALLVRQLVSRWQSLHAQLQRMDQRRELYLRSLLPQRQHLAEASLNAYDNDEGDFAEALRARIGELNAKIELLNIDVQRRELQAQMAYLEVGIRHDEGGGHE